MRMSQMAASVESRGINLMQSRLFLKACSSVGGTRDKETVRQTDSLLIYYTLMLERLSED